MSSRTTVRTVTFARPFSLQGANGEIFPSGAYTVETDEDLIEGLSFPAYRRTATWMRMPATQGVGGAAQVLFIDPRELEEREMLLSMPPDSVATPTDQPEGPPQ